MTNRFTKTTESKFYFDVGANDGSSMVRYANEENSIVFAFEPTPRLVKLLNDSYSHLPNYNVIPKAVNDVPGKLKFFISGNADWGCSSLCNFQEPEVLNKKWPGRTDFKVTDEIEVDVIRLDSFIEEKKKSGVDITEIEYFHCDVQGKDLEALKSMGKYLHLIKRGVIEMPTSHENKLYKDQKWLDVDAIKFLEDNNFEITAVSSNDITRNEVNIYFQRK
jgi:FkbM family methyltransferase